MLCASGAAEWVGRGFTGVKAKIGYPTVREDLEVIRAIRQAVGDSVAIMVDYNQCLTPAEAVQRLRVLDGEGLTWVEEPTLAHDYAGHALIAREADTPIQCGENWWGTLDLRHALAAQASDFIMPDLMKIGGVTGWLRAAALAQAEEHPRLQPPLARGQRTTAVRDADRPLAGVRRLVEPDPGRPPADPWTEWPSSIRRSGPAYPGTKRPSNGFPPSELRSATYSSRETRRE